MNTFTDPVKDPEIQKIILCNDIGIIANIIAKRLDLSPLRALDIFYQSKTCADLHDRSSGLYLYGNEYIADEFMREKQKKY